LREGHEDLQGVGVIAVLLICPAIRAGGGSLSADDIAKIKRVHSKYEEAWLKGDADGVRALFTEDCVLLPPHETKLESGKRD